MTNMTTNLELVQLRRMRMSEDYTVFGYGSLIWKVCYIICHNSQALYPLLIDFPRAASAACHSQASVISTNLFTRQSLIDTHRVRFS